MEIKSTIPIVLPQYLLAILRTLADQVLVGTLILGLMVGNIDAYPLFENPGNDNFGLTSDSPAIDTGTLTVCPTTDIINNPRPLELTCDMGAYEYLGIYLRKYVNKSEPLPGQTIIYSINSVNSLTGTITGSVISDTLP